MACTVAVGQWLERAIRADPAKRGEYFSLLWPLRKNEFYIWQFSKKINLKFGFH